MEGMLASRSYALNGVLNGVDLDELDPETEPHIFQNFSKTNYTRCKQGNKAGLQKELGLPERKEVHTPCTCQLWICCVTSQQVWTQKTACIKDRDGGFKSCIHKQQQ